MKLSEIGEFGLIDLIKEETLADVSSVIAGIGDDAAVYIPGQRQLGLLTTDMLVENIHFDLRTTTPWQLGYKAVAVNLSDIAAMGGKPRHMTVSLGLPPAVEVEFIVALYNGMKELCREFGVNIVGGDTVSSPHGLVINVAVVGEVAPLDLVRRSGAGPGDAVVVTGTVGDSACGLDLLAITGWEEYSFSWPLVTAHLTPRPQVAAGLNLAQWGATSANDISDGLASEANEIAKAGGVGVRLYADRLPLSRELGLAAGLLGKKTALDYALYGGEDYQLLFTIPPARLADLPQDGVLFTVVGEITKEQEVVLVDGEGAAAPLAANGYNHFR